MLYRTVWCITKYFDEDIRIFTLCNLQENGLILNNVTIRPTDVFLVLLSWMHPEEWFFNAYSYIDSLGLSEKQFYIMCNTTQQMHDAYTAGFSNAYFINRHFNMDPQFFTIDQRPKRFDVCIFGEQLDRNRIPSAFHLSNLAIIDGLGQWNREWMYPRNAFRNGPDTILHSSKSDAPIIQQTMRESYTGLCLALKESMCYSSVEFFFNGVPVVTTDNDTGRMEWFNARNSIIIPNADPATIKMGVEKAKEMVLDGVFRPEIIRQDAIDLWTSFRQNFVAMLSDIFKSRNLPDLSENLYNRTHYHRFLYKSCWKGYEPTIRVFQ